jgi:hypothetical protein
MEENTDVFKTVTLGGLDSPSVDVCDPCLIIALKKDVLTLGIQINELATGLNKALALLHMVVDLKLPMDLASSLVKLAVDEHAAKLSAAKMNEDAK